LWRIGVAELRLLDQQDVRLRLREPQLHGLLPCLERGDVPGRDPHRGYADGSNVSRTLAAIRSVIPFRTADPAELSGLRRAWSSVQPVNSGAMSSLGWSARTSARSSGAHRSGSRPEMSIAVPTSSRGPSAANGVSTTTPMSPTMTA